jgi:hypothetical protein
MAAGPLHSPLGLKRGRKGLAEEWKAIRRGWYVGGAEFKERMLALVEQPLRQGEAAPIAGRPSGRTVRRKGAWEKEVLAWWLCQHTTARRRRVSERLGMGDESRVTQAIGRLKRKGQPELERLKRRLEQVYENHNREVEARILCEFRDPFTFTITTPLGQSPTQYLIR